MLAKPKKPDAWVEMFKRGTRLSYKKGEYIIRPGEQPSAVFYIEKGLIKAFDITKYGEENLLIIRKAHEIFPLIWAITGREYSVIYQALDDVVVWRVAREQYLKHMQTNQDALSSLLEMTVEMYRIHSDRIRCLEYRTVRERLVAFLLSSSERFGVKTKQGILLDVPLRQQDIASSINASRETAGRELSALEQKGLIVVERSKVILKNVKKLEEYL